MKIYMFIVLLLHSLIYLSIFVYKKRHSPSFKLKDSKMLLVGSIFSIVIYFNFFVYLYTEKYDIFTIGIALSWLISCSISYMITTK